MSPGVLGDEAEHLLVLPELAFRVEPHGDVGDGDADAAAALREEAVDGHAEALGAGAFPPLEIPHEPALLAVEDGQDAPGHGGDGALLVREGAAEGAVVLAVLLPGGDQGVQGAVQALPGGVGGDEGDRLY